MSDDESKIIKPPTEIITPSPEALKLLGKWDAERVSERLAELEVKRGPLSLVQPPPGFYTAAVTIADVRADEPELIYYGAQTLWWSHKREHLRRHPTAGLPCCPRGGMLLQTDDTEGFLNAAESNPDFYGEYGLVAFIAAHNDNMLLHEGSKRHTCFERWEQYNEVLKRQGFVAVKCDDCAEADAEADDGQDA